MKDKDTLDDLIFEDFGYKWPIIRKWKAFKTIGAILFGTPMIVASGIVSYVLYRVYEETNDTTLPILGTIYLGLGWYRLYDVFRDK